MKKCPYCAEDIQDEAIVCRYCKRDLPGSAQPSGATSQASERSRSPRRTGRFILYAVGILLLLSIIGQFLPDQRDTGSTGSTNPAHAALLNSTEDQRARVLRAAVVSVGESCDEITRTFHQGTERKSGDEMWNVACRNGNTFAVSVTNDTKGQTGVLSCAVLKAVAQDECFEKY